MTSARPGLARWLLAVTVAESVGFVAPAVTGATTGGRYEAMVAAGLVEGAVLGAGQVLGAGRQVLPAVRWTVATAVGAGVAWAIAMLPTVLDVPWTDPFVLAAVVAAGAVALLAMPVLQWAATGFRRGLAGWIPVSAGAWAVGLVWTLAPSPLIDERTPVPVLVGVYAVAGVLMAATVALLTGLAVRRLPGFRRPVEDAEPVRRVREAQRRAA